MAWTSVPDKASGDVFTEANWDTHIRDNLNTGVPVMLADSTLGASAASIDFTSINQTFTHLMLVCYLRSDTVATTQNANVRFNADTGSNYDYQSLNGSAATAAAAETFAGSTIFAGTIPAASATANVFGGIVIEIPYYSQSTNNKALIATSALKSGTTTGTLGIRTNAGFWRSSAAITQVTILPSLNNFAAGSRITLYGMP